MRRKGRGSKKPERRCESCEALEYELGSEKPKLPPRWRPLSKETFYRCDDCKRYRRVWFDGREMHWEVERLPSVAKPFLRGRAELSDLWRARQERGWTATAILDWVVRADFDFSRFARDAMRRIGAAGTSDAERARLLVLLRCAATGESGQALWRAIRNGRGEPVKLEISPLLAIVEREPRTDQHAHRKLIEEVERISWALLGSDHHRAVDLVEPRPGQRERLHQATGHVPQAREGGRRSEPPEAISRSPGPEPPSELDSLEESLIEIEALEGSKGHRIDDVFLVRLAGVTGRMRELAVTSERERALATRARNLLARVDSGGHVPPSQRESVDAALGETAASSDEDEPAPARARQAPGASPSDRGPFGEPTFVAPLAAPASWSPTATCRTFLLALPFLLPGVLLKLLFVEGIAPETQVGESAFFAIPSWCLSGGLLVAGAVRARIPESTLLGLALSRAIHFAANGICCWLGTLAWAGVATVAALLLTGHEQEAEVSDSALALSALFMLPWLWCVARIWPGYVSAHLTLAARA